MKETLTLLLFLTCIAMSVLIVRLEDYQKMFFDSLKSLNDSVNNNVGIESSDSSNKKYDNELGNAKYELESVNVTIDEVVIEDEINFSNIYAYLNMTRSEIEDKCEVRAKYAQSKFLTDYRVITFDDSLGFNFDENENLLWIEVMDTNKVLNIDNKNFEVIAKQLGKGKLKKMKNMDYNYEYYQLNYNIRNMHIAFLSYYEDGTKNICVVQ